MGYHIATSMEDFSKRMAPFHIVSNAGMSNAHYNSGGLNEPVEPFKHGKPWKLDRDDVE